MVEVLQKIIDNNGACSIVDCTECPFVKWYKDLNGKDVMCMGFLLSMEERNIPKKDRYELARYYLEEMNNGV